MRQVLVTDLNRPNISRSPKMLSPRAEHPRCVVLTVWRTLRLLLNDGGLLSRRVFSRTYSDDPLLALLMRCG